MRHPLFFLLFLSPILLFAAPKGYFEFAVPWSATNSGVPIDLSFLNATPAGKNGRILARDGHFIEENTGTRIRFFGVNIGADEAFPEKADADLFARQLARAGVNIARLHHLDNCWSIPYGGSIWNRNRSDRQVFDPSQLDKLEYLISRLKANGIFVNINLKVSKELTPSDGMPDSIRQVAGIFIHQKRLDFFQRRMIELQKDYARKLLTHINPYTGLSLVEDPAVAVVEINNENSLLGFWTRSLGRDLDRLPEPFVTELRTSWNSWLKKRYSSDAELLRKWTEGMTPAGESILSGANVWSSENQSGSEVRLTPSSVKPGQTSAPDVLAEILKISDTDWHIQTHLTGLTLKEGAFYTLTFRAKADAVHKIAVTVNKDKADWHNMGLWAATEAGPAWKDYSFTFKATTVEPASVRIAFILGSSTGKVWLSDIKLVSGAPDSGPGKDESLAKGTMKIPKNATDRQWSDWIAFLADTERAYADEMLSYLRNDLKVKSSVLLTQIDYGGTAGMFREQNMDIADTHAYWQHPSFQGGAWDPAKWTIQNSPQIAVFGDRGFGELGQLAMNRVAGKPFSVSEYDHPAPTDYASEMLPVYAAFACVQDWDAIYTFATGKYGAESKPDRITGFFDQNNHPAKWYFYPSAALVFRLGLIRPASASAKVELAPPLWKDYAFSSDAWNALVPQGPFGFLTRRLSIDDHGAATHLVEQGSPAAGDVHLVKTASGQVLAAFNPSAALVSGYIGANTISAGDASFAAPSFGNNFASITVVGTDGRPLRTAKSVLVTVCGRVENQDMGWNRTRTSVGADWGEGPPIAETVPVTVTVKRDTKDSVWALDPSGKKKKQVQSSYKDGSVIFTVKPADSTLLYEIKTK
jgi:hypothetical protein